MTLFTAMRGMSCYNPSPYVSWWFTPCLALRLPSGQDLDTTTLLEKCVKVVSSCPVEAGGREGSLNLLKLFGFPAYILVPAIHRLDVFGLVRDLMIWPHDI